MVEKHYVFLKKGFTVKEVYIEPEHEWCHWRKGDDRVKVYNDIDPKTGERTGGFYEEDTIFNTVDEAKNGLKVFLNSLINKNLKEIKALEKRNKELNKIISDI